MEKKFIFMLHHAVCDTKAKEHRQGQSISDLDSLPISWTIYFKWKCKTFFIRWCCEI